MDLATVGFAFAVVVHAASAWRTARVNSFIESSPLARSIFVAGLAATALWAAAGLAVGLASANVLLSAVQSSLDLARYAAWILLLLTLIRRARTFSDIGIGALATGGLLWVSLSGAVWAREAGFIAETGLWGRLLLLGHLALPVAGLGLVEQLYKNLAEDHRWHAKPLCLGLASVFLFDIYLYSYATLFGEFDSASKAVRPVAHAVAVPLLLAATRRHGQWIRSLQVSRVAAVHTATFTLVGLYLIVVSGIGYYIRVFGGTWGEALQLSLLCLALVGLAVFLFSQSWRAKIRVAIAKNFYSYRYDYRMEWLQFTAMLASGNSPRETGDRIIRGLAGMVQSPAGALWVKAFHSAAFTQISSWNVDRSAEDEYPGSAFATRLLESGWIVDLVEYRSSPKSYGDWIIPPWLLANDRNWLVIPLPVAGELIGFVVLQRPDVRIDLSWEVRDILKTAAHQAASFLAQIHATEALVEARKFESFNRMSAFVVHDLKNIVAQLSLMMQNAKRLQDNPEFRQDMFTTIENSLQKMRQLMLQLRDGAVPAGASLGVELAPILEEAQAQARRRGRPMNLNISARLATRGHGDRVTRVLGHLVQNALDATSEKGEVWATLDKAGGQARVVVGDTGEGMSPEFVKDGLFRPFTTTKSHGMGIGAYESLQYIEGIGGKIAIDSELGRGTIITVLLPLFELHEATNVELVREA